MIKNVIFDIGRVLIEYEPLKYLAELGYNENEIRELDAAVFSNPLWREIDRGTYTISEAIDIFCREHPEHEQKIRRILAPGWENILIEKTETTKFLAELSMAGYKTYILSNFESHSFEYISNKYRFFDLFDGHAVSGYLGVIKPEPGIYEYLLNTYSLTPEETVFIDDVAENLVGAEKFGIKTILFTDISEVRTRFAELDVLKC